MKPWHVLVVGLVAISAGTWLAIRRIETTAPVAQPEVVTPIAPPAIVAAPQPVKPVQKLRTVAKHRATPTTAPQTVAPAPPFWQSRDGDAGAIFSGADPRDPRVYH